jgi:hypothetical protein
MVLMKWCSWTQALRQPVASVSILIMSQLQRGSLRSTPFDSFASNAAHICFLSCAVTHNSIDDSSDSVTYSGNWDAFHDDQGVYFNDTYQYAKVAVIMLLSLL